MSLYFANLDAPMWRAVRLLYLEDKVVEALQEAEKLGGDDTNTLFAEAEVRKRGEQFQVRPWLTVEAIVEEVENELPIVRDVVGVACEGVAHRFGWDNEKPTLVSILSKDVEAYWMPARWGYFVDKTPYDKVVLPHHLAYNPRALTTTIQHEFMHVITYNLTHGNAPSWLGEAMSTYAEGRFDRGHWQAVQQGAAKWLTPTDLSMIVSHDNRDEKLQVAISWGYAQANLIARYLATLGGDVKLGEFLRAIGDESFAISLGEQILGRSRTDAALRRVYGLSERELFANSLARAKESGFPIP